jgi:hypothetical protein
VLLGDGNKVCTATGVPTGCTVTGQQFIVYKTGSSTFAPSVIPGSATPGSGSNGPAALPTSVYGASSGGATVTYSYALSSTAGYYNMTISLNGLVTPGGVETVGIVLSDIGNNNYVLSEGQTTITVAAAGAIAIPATPITLKPVIAKAYLVGPSSGVATGGNSTTSPTAMNFQFTAYAADELGYPIPTQGSNVFDNGAFSVAQYQSGAAPGTLAIWPYPTTVTPLAGNTSLNPALVSSSNGQVALAGTASLATTNASALGQTSLFLTYSQGTGAAAFTFVPGTQITIGSDVVTVTKSTTIAAAGSGSVSFTPALASPYASALGVTLTAANALPTTGTMAWNTPGILIPNLAWSQSSGTPTISSTSSYAAGWAVNVVATVPGAYSVVVTGALTAPTAGAVTGYTYTPGTNYPAFVGSPIVLSAPVPFIVSSGAGINFQ